MKTLSITPAQYATLLKCIATSSVIYGTLGEFDADHYSQDKMNIDELASDCLASAGDFGFNASHIDKIDGEHTFSEDYMDNILANIATYDETSFWTELSTRFTYQEIEKKYSESAFKRLSDEERYHLVEKLEEKYQNAFEQYDMDCVKFEKPEKKEKNSK
jgi:hypothetical protein